MCNTEFRSSEENTRHAKMSQPSLIQYGYSLIFYLTYCFFVHLDQFLMNIFTPLMETGMFHAFLRITKSSIAQTYLNKIILD